VITLKIRKAFNLIIQFFFVIFFITSLVGSIYIIKIMTKSNTPKVATIINNSSSIIYDSDGMNITTLNLVNNNSVQYDDLPDVFINALISAEDARFFEHSGVDFQRILSAIINNISTDSTQGASTLTQQLIKNIYLDPSKTLERKISEIIMALNLESKMTKEDILLAYVNNIMFDGVTIGVNSASLKLFSKPINNVNLAEAALLAGLVNAPSYYNPIKNPVNAKDRMDTVLSLMYRHNYITDTQLNDARKVQISDLINLSEYKETTYPYQSYLDIVYNEVIELTGYNPLTTPLIIETYMDTDLQALIDSIQNNEDSTIKFTDDNQQIAISVVDNKNGALVAAGGGRNYAGQLLFNRATDMKNQPASTMKPLLSYALAVEHLGWNNKQVLKDEPYSYSGSNLNVNNVDHTYMGEILIEEAIGYSRNTTALTTLEKVINKVGINTVTDYLKNINLLDVSSDKFNLSYGLGAMHHGISPTQLASAYSMLARDGYFTPAYTVKRIIAQETNKVIYTHKQEEKQVLSKETAFIISDILKSVVNNNYYNLGTVKIDNVEMHAKTGTSSFDGNLLKELGYPMDASKDIWIAGYSADYTTVVWSGFDYPVKGEENYFKAGSDARKYIPRKAFTKIMNYQSKKGEKISLPSTLSPIQIVKGTNLLPDEYTPRKLITTAYYKKGDEPTETISPPKLDDVSRLDLLLIGNTLHISFKDDLFDIVDVTSQKQIIDYSSIYGNIEYVVETINQNGITNTFTSNNSSFSFNLNDSGFLKIKAYTRYAYIKNITSNIYETNYYSLFTF
jgi:penicillin-binding protein 1A